MVFEENLFGNLSASGPLILGKKLLVKSKLDDLISLPLSATNFSSHGHQMLASVVCLMLKLIFNFFLFKHTFKLVTQLYRIVHNLCTNKSLLRCNRPHNNDTNNNESKLGAYSNGVRENRKILAFNSLVLLFLISVRSANACDPWRVSDCQGAPTTAEEEIMKSDDYTKEQLYKYCDKGKAYVDCVNSKLKCCDLKPELRGSLSAHEKNLQKVAWKLGPYCAGLGESNVINYKCRTTTRATTTTTGKSTKPTMPPCPIEKAGEECSHYLDGRVKFEETWNVYDKMQWCRDAIDYVNCASGYLLNCNISSLKNEADQLQSFIDYVTKSSNVHCPGGITGCENNTNDIRCRMGIRYFIGEYNTNSGGASSARYSLYHALALGSMCLLSFF